MSGRFVGKETTGCLRQPAITSTNQCVAALPLYRTVMAQSSRKPSRRRQGDNGVFINDEGECT